MNVTLSQPLRTADRSREAGSGLHRPPAEALTAGGTAGDGNGTLDAAIRAIAAIRGAKSGARVSMRAPVRELEVSARRDHLDALMAVLPDIRAAGRVEHTELRFCDQPEPAYRVTL